MTYWESIVDDAINDLLETIEKYGLADVDLIDTDSIKREIENHKECFVGCDFHSVEDNITNYPIYVYMCCGARDICIDCLECGNLIWSLESYLYELGEEDAI